MKTTTREPKEMIIAESAILQVLSQLSDDAKKERDYNRKQLLESQCEAIAEYLSTVRDYVRLMKLKAANLQVMVQTYRSLNADSKEFNEIMVNKYAELSKRKKA